MANLGILGQDNTVSHISSSSSYTPKKKKKKDEEIKTTQTIETKDIRTQKTEQPKKSTVGTVNSEGYTETSKKYGDYKYQDYANKKDYKIYTKDNKSYYYDEKNKRYVDMDEQSMTTKELDKKEYKNAVKQGYKGSRTYNSKDVQVEPSKVADKVALESSDLTKEEKEKYKKSLIKQEKQKGKETNFVKKSGTGIDALTGAWNNQVVNPNGVLQENVIQPISNAGRIYESGKMNNELALEWYKKMQGKPNKADELQAKADTFNRFNQDVASGDIGAVGQTIQNLNTQVESLKNQGIAATAGGIVGGAGGAIVGLKSGNPIGGAIKGAKLGSKAGYAFGSTPYMYKLEAGNQYKDLREMGVSHKKAKKVAKAVGSINAAIESGENIIDLFSFEGAGKIASNEVKNKALKQMRDEVSEVVEELGEKNAKSYLARLYGNEVAENIVKTYAKNVASETGEEATQEAVGILGERYATGSEGIDRGISLQQDLRRIGQSGFAGGTSALLMGIPTSLGGNAVSYGAGKANNIISNRGVQDGNILNNNDTVVPNTNQIREIVEQKNNGEIDAEEANRRIADVQNGTYQQNQNNQAVIQEAQRQFDAINQAEASGQIDTQTANQERQALINTMSQMTQQNGTQERVVQETQQETPKQEVKSNDNKTEKVETPKIKVKSNVEVGKQYTYSNNGSTARYEVKEIKDDGNVVVEIKSSSDPNIIGKKYSLKGDNKSLTNAQEYKSNIKYEDLSKDLKATRYDKKMYAKAKNTDMDMSEYDRTMEFITPNKAGNYSKQQILTLAEELGKKSKATTGEELKQEAINYWVNKEPYKKTDSKTKYLGMDEFLKAYYKGAGVGTKIETQETTQTETQKATQEPSLKNAKNYYNRNLGKYTPGDAFESAIGEYQLRPEEAQNLRDYTIKKYPDYADEINRRYNDLYEQEETTKIEEQSKEEPKVEQPKVEEKPKIETKEQEQEYFEDNGVPKESAKVLSEMPKPPKESLSERIKNKKASFAEEISYVKRNIVDKGESVYSLSKKTKNKLLYAKYDKRGTTTGEANYDIGVAQTDLNGKKYSNFTNKKGKKVSMGLNDIWKDVDTQAANEYLAHWLNVDRYKQVNQKGLEMQDALQKQIDEGKLTQQEADKIIQNNEGTKYVFGPDITDEVSKQKIAELEEQHPELKQFGENIWQYGRNQLQNMVDAGMISEQQAKQYSKDTPHYVRLQRDIPKDSTSMIVFDKNGNAKVNNQVKEFKGSTLNILPFKETMANYTLDVRNSIRDNLFAEELAKTLGMSATGEQITSVDDIMGINPELIKDNGDGTYSLTFFNKGNATTMPITQGIYEALQPNKHYKFEDLALFKGVRKFDSVRKALLTDKNPMFLATNMMKDLFDAPLNSKHPIAFAKNYPRAIEQVLRNGKYYQQYQALGGLQNSYFENNEFKNKGSMKNPLNWIAKANNAIEQFPRLAEFMSTMEKTGNIDEAMYNAAEITTNFKRGGDVAKAANRNGATFLNASIQGFSKQWRNFSDIQNPKQATQMLLKVMILGIAPALINDLVYEDDDEYKEMQDYQKDRYYLLKGKDGEWVRIPKGRAVSIFQSAARRTKYALGGDQNAFKEFTKFASSQVAPNNPFENNIISPFVDVSRNESWSGSKIIPQSMEKKKAEKQYNEKTDKLSRKISEEVNKNEFLKRIIPKNFRSAMGINYLIDQYSGAIGDVGLPYITPKATSKDRNPLAAPILDKFTTDVIYNNKNVGAFYDTMNSLAEEDETPVDRAKNNYMNSKSYALSQLYKQQRNIQSDESLSKSEKYEKAREVQKEINKFTKDTVKAVNDVQQEEYYLKIGDSYYKRVVQDGEEKFVQDTSKKIPTEKYALYDYFREKYEKSKEKKK